MEEEVSDLKAEHAGSNTLSIARIRHAEHKDDLTITSITKLNE